VRSVHLIASPPAPGDRAATGTFRLEAARARWHFQLEGEDSDARTTTDRAGSPLMACSTEPPTSHPPGRQPAPPASPAHIRPFIRTVRQAIPMS
jgi:hypothetical protein